MNRVDIPCSGIGEDRDQHVLLHVKRPGIESELKFPTFEENSVGDHRCHEVAERDHRDLGGDGGDGERFSTVPEELVKKGEEDAS